MRGKKDKELRKMSRKELIDIIYEMKRNEIQLRQQLDAMEKKWREREVKLSKVGSLAEASLALYGVFDAAQKAADAYVRGVKSAYGKDRDLPAENLSSTPGKKDE